MKNLDRKNQPENLSDNINIEQFKSYINPFNLPETHAHLKEEVLNSLNTLSRSEYKSYKKRIWQILSRYNGKLGDKGVELMQWKFLLSDLKRIENLSQTQIRNIQPPKQPKINDTPSGTTEKPSTLPEMTNLGHFRIYINNFNISNQQLKNEILSSLSSLEGYLQKEGHHWEEIKTILNRYYGKLNNDITLTSKLNFLLKDLKRLERKYQAEKSKIEEDRKNYEALIMANQFLKNADFPFFDHIKDKLEKAESYSIDEIVEKSRQIKINQNKFTKKEWDDFFDDIRSDIRPNQRHDFEKAVNEFKQTTTYTSAVENVSFMENLRGIFNLYEDLENNINKMTNDIYGEKNDDFPPKKIEILGVEYTFTNKRYALLALYKMKLIFSEISNDKTFNKEWAFFNFITKPFVHGAEAGKMGWDVTTSLPLGGLEYLLGIFVAGAVGIGTTGLHALPLVPIVGIIESVTRNTKSFVAIRFGGKNYSKGVATWLKFLDGTHKFFHYLKVTRPVNWFVVNPVKWFSAPFQGLLESGEKEYLDTLLRTERGITIVDGIRQITPESSGIENYRLQELQQRIQILDFFEKYYAHDPKRLKQIDTIKNVKNFFRGGSLVSSGDTFYQRLWDMHNGTGFGGKVWQTITISKYKDRMFQFVNDSLSKQRAVVGQFFEGGVSVKEGGDISDFMEKRGDKYEIKEAKKGTFIKRIEAAVDLEGTVSNGDEIARNRLMRMYLMRLLKMETFRTDPEIIRQDMMLISDGYLPDFEMERIIKAEIGGDPALKKDMQKFINHIYERKWVGTEGELMREIQSIRNGNFRLATKVRLYNEQEKRNKLDRGKDLLAEKYIVDDALTEQKFKGSFESEIELARMFHGLKTPEQINEKLNEMFKDIKGINAEQIKIDYTNSHVRYLVEQMLGQSNKTYQNACVPFQTQQNFDQMRVDYKNEYIVREKLREILFTQMDAELDKIEQEQDEIKQKKDLEKFEERYGMEKGKFKQGSPIIDDAKKYDGIQKKYGNIFNTVEGKMLDYIRLDNDKLSQKAEELIKNAKNNMTIEIKNKIDQLENVLKLKIKSGEYVKLEQLEIFLKNIISGDLISIEANKIDFRTATLGTNASSVIIAPNKTLSVATGNFEDGKAEIKDFDITFTENSEMEEIVKKRNEFIEKYEKKEEELKDKESYKDSKEELSRKGRNKSPKERREILQKQIGNLESKYSGIRNISDMAAEIVRVEIEKTKLETDFASYIKSKPVFIDFTTKANLNIRRITPEEIRTTKMQDFIVHAVKKGAKLP